MGAVDYRSLVPRTPPKGLREWTLKTCRSELDQYGLVYEVDYDDPFCDWPLALPEGYKRTKMVRVTCSCCKVLVNKRSAIRDYYVSDGCHVMSADVIEQTGELVLTGWTVQRRVYKYNGDSLSIIPSEAYVFTATDCYQLMGWRNGYSGHGGYFIQYEGKWRQPKAWAECWGQEEHIFGLSPELIGQSCLPHCKLDAYMAERPGAMRYPVAYLRLYQAHPNVESVLLHGLPRVLDDLIHAKAGTESWAKTNEQGLMELPEIDWTQTRPAQMLHLTKEELRMGRTQDWDKLTWDLFVGAKRIGELLTAEDIRNAFRLGDEHVTELVPRGQVGKSIRYLLRQCEVLAVEADDAGADPRPDAQLLTDYWTMAETLGRDLSEASVKYPADLIAAHDRAAELMKQKETEGMADLFRVRRRLLKKYTYVAHGLLIRPAASQRELTAEGDALHHCVGTYGKRHAAGKTAIFFIRRTDRPRESYFTLELDEKKLEVRQNRGNHNCSRTQEVEAFEKEWLEWVRAGAPRGRNGRPLDVKKIGRRVGAA